MTPSYPNPPLSPSPDPIGRSTSDHDYHIQDQQIQFSLSPSPHATSASYSPSSSLSSFPNFFNNLTDHQDQRGFSDIEDQHEVVNLHGGSSLIDDQFFPSLNSLSTVKTGDHDHESNYGDLKFSISNSKEAEDYHDDHHKGTEDGSSSVKWMSSKMRLMKKMMNTNPNQIVEETTKQIMYDHGNLHQHQQTSYIFNIENSSNNFSKYNNNNTTIRVCTDCNTTKTPLWRSGPSGPKTLCNACGIRQRKARRAMAAAAAKDQTVVLEEDHTITSTTKTTNKVVNKMKRSSSFHKMKRSASPTTTSQNGFIAPYKKRFKIVASDPPHENMNHKKICFEDFTLSLMNKQNNSGFHKVFPQDEKEAAILLMALSCGLVHG